MKRAIFIVLGWLTAAIVLYVLLLALELYWNLYDWQPRTDWKASGLILTMFIVLAVMRFLAKAGRDRLSRFVSLIACLALLALAIYVFPPEQLTHGVFARTAASPLWYRASRLLFMTLPGVFWGIELFHKERVLK